jgi:hypothetical protein
MRVNLLCIMYVSLAEISQHLTSFCIWMHLNAFECIWLHLIAFALSISPIFSLRTYRCTKDLSLSLSLSSCMLYPSLRSSPRAITGALKKWWGSWLLCGIIESKTELVAALARMSAVTGSGHTWRMVADQHPSVVVAAGRAAASLQ